MTLETNESPGFATVISASGPVRRKLRLHCLERPGGFLNSLLVPLLWEV